METYLQLNTNDKKRLVLLAKSKLLSVSTTANIIIKWYFYPVNQMYKTYLNKGENSLHIKIKNENKNPINSMNATNCIFCFFNKPNNLINWSNLDRKIQSELDKTQDPNYNKNEEIRIAYRLKKGQFA